ncbi:MAG: hypothetical protein ABSA97_08080 [Verrucomicrobiia bacterium]
MKPRFQTQHYAEETGNEVETKVETAFKNQRVSSGKVETSRKRVFEKLLETNASKLPFVSNDSGNAVLQRV